MPKVTNKYVSGIAL